MARVIGEVGIADDDKGLGASVLPTSLVNGAWTNKRAFEQPIVRSFVQNDNVAGEEGPKDVRTTSRASRSNKKVAVVLTAPAILSAITPRKREREVEWRDEKGRERKAKKLRRQTMIEERKEERE